MQAPIALFVYNRIDQTTQTLEALKMNTLAKESQLIIFSDGAKTGSEEQVLSLRKYLRGVTGFKSVAIHESTENKGLANSITEGVTTVLKQFNSVIVMEDDLISSPAFLEYMNNALSLYENYEEVISIHGYVYPVKGVLPETFFLKGADCWGWATWKRGWDLFEKDGKILLEQLENRRLIKEFDFDNSYSYSQMLKNQTIGKNNSWAVRWYASAFLKDKLTLYPGVSYIENIGFDGSGTHCSDTEGDFFKGSVDLNTLVDIKKIEICQSPLGRNEFIKYFNSTQRSIKEVIKKFTPNCLLKIWNKFKGKGEF